jgi:hypothetical protein
MKSDYDRYREQEKQRAATESIERQDARFAQTYLRQVVEAFRAGREYPNLDKIRRDFYKIAKNNLGMSVKGAKAWASLQVEEARRLGAAQIDAESSGSPEA